jgi:hypothetical protein
MPTQIPLVELDPDGKPSVLNYNVPDPTSYHGRHLIRLEFPAGVFIKMPAPPREVPAATGKGNEGVRQWAFSRTILTSNLVSLRKASVSKTRNTINSLREGTQKLEIVSSAVARVQPAELLDAVSDANIEANSKVGRLPFVVKTLSGASAVQFARPPVEPLPALYLVETVRLSNFLGDYGAGRTLHTFSLLPGEKTRITVNTYRNSSETATEASSIFDSYTSETADAFESAVQAETTAKDTAEQHVEWNVQAEAEGNWGVASASVSAGASGGSNTAREEFAKNASQAVEKHAQSASAKRDVTVNNTTTATIETGEQTAVERQIENINVGRTLNFVFRQLNQEFYSVLHLVDVRVGFFDGFAEHTREVSVGDIDRLLEYCVKTPEDRTSIKADILHALGNILDWRHEARSMLATRILPQRSGTALPVQVIDRDLRSTVSLGDRPIPVEGIPLDVRRVVLRTDGVIVEALLGQSPALDDYSADLQTAKVEERRLENQRLALELDERRARLRILESGDAAAAQRYAQMFGTPPVPKNDEKP